MADIILCQECDSLFGIKEIELVRRSHSTTWWCRERALAHRDWSPGRSVPMRVRVISADVRVNADAS